MATEKRKTITYMRKDNRHPKLKPKASNPWLHVQGQTVDMPLKESEAIHCCPLIITDYAFIHSWSQAKSFNTIYWALKCAGLISSLYQNLPFLFLPMTFCFTVSPFWNTFNPFFYYSSHEHFSFNEHLC